jgi:hypothetical protein
LIAPLRKRKLDGTQYTRRRIIEAKIIELASLSRYELFVRCAIRQKDDPGYVPSECLLYFIRSSRADNSDTYFERLYKILVERVLRCLPNAEISNGNTTSLTKSTIREKVFGRFVDLLVSDRNAYLDKLDYYEINFESALKNLRRDAQNQVWKEENRSTTLYDEETGEPMTAVEHAAGSFDPCKESAFADDDYRSCLYAAIDTLPPEQRRVVVMILQGMPIDSKDPSVLTIRKVLGKTEKTVRNYRDKAYAVLRVALNEGEDL